MKFDPPVEDGFEARKRLFEWRDKAFEHFDVVRSYQAYWRVANRQPEMPAITYFSPPALFPLTLPILLALSVQMFALFGSGSYADTFRQKIAAWGGKGLLPGSAVVAGFIVRLSSILFLC